EQRVRSLEIRFHVLALVSERNLGNVLAREQIGRRVVHNPCKMHLDRGIRRESDRLVERGARLGRAVVGDENSPVHGSLLTPESASLSTAPGSARPQTRS